MRTGLGQTRQKTSRPVRAVIAAGICLQCPEKTVEHFTDVNMSSSAATRSRAAPTVASAYPSGRKMGGRPTAAAVRPSKPVRSAPMAGWLSAAVVMVASLGA